MHYIVQDFLTPLSKYYLYIHKHLQCNIQPTSIIFFSMHPYTQEKNTS